MAVEHGAWTNERLDDLAIGMRDGFARVDQDIRDLRGEIAAMHQTMIRFGSRMLIGMVVSFISLLAAIIAQG